MILGLPIAVIQGIDSFVAQRLFEELVKQDLMVLGIGEYVPESMRNGHFELRGSIEEINENVSYVFDFSGNQAIWRKWGKTGTKITVITSELKRKSELTQWENKLAMSDNWRIVEVVNTFGPGMGMESWLGKIFWEATKNQPLEVPEEIKIRVLPVSEAVEGILRATLLSGTSGEHYVLGGEEIETERWATILATRAKMTKKQLIYKSGFINDDEGTIEATGRKLHFAAKRPIEEAVDETLQYFFTQADNQIRQQGPAEKKLSYWQVEKIEEIAEEKKVEEKPEESQEPIIKNSHLVIEEPEEIPMVIDDDLIEEEEENVGQNPDVKIQMSNDKTAEGRHDLNGEGGKKREVKKKWRLPYWKVIAAGVLVSIGLVTPIRWLLTTQKAVTDLKVERNLITQKQWDKADKLSDENINGLREIENSLTDWKLKRINLVGNYAQALKTLEEGWITTKQGVAVAKSGSEVAQAIWGEKEINWEITLTTLDKQLATLEAESGILSARLSGNWQWLPGRWRSQVSDYKTSLDASRASLKKSRKLLAVWPQIIGSDGSRKDYLVVFQNENELRPTGGFIGSYGIVSFNGGKLIDFSIKDVYEADGQLKGHVEPPAEIKNYLGEASWYMRDANWQADFRESAKTISWFFDKETGRSVDGVIGIDLAVAKEILAATGEVYVPDFKQKINKDNLYEQAEFYAEKNFFPGSTQKENFLGNLGKILFDTVKTAKPETQAKLLDGMLKMADENELLVAMGNKEVAAGIADLGWDGALYEGKCQKANCLADYLYLVEANLGVNKANYFLKRSVEETVDLSLNSVTRVVRINYENTAQSTTWPGGDYKNYLRVYVPANINLASITVADGNDPAIQKTLSMNDLKIQTMGNKKEIGFLVTVPVTKKRVVEIRYATTITLNQADSFSYLNYIQKQPGWGETTKWVALVSFPNGWQPTQAQPAASIVQGKLLFNQLLMEDMPMGVEISK